LGLTVPKLGHLEVGFFLCGDRLEVKKTEEEAQEEKGSPAVPAEAFQVLSE
jgi:hypothetical protein